jgi:rhodanese-related sulfurtransferase
MKAKSNIIFIILFAVTLLFTGTFLLLGFNPLQLLSSENITVQQLHSMLDENYQFVDIRTAGEYSAGHIDEFTINLDFYKFEQNLSLLDVLDKNKTTVIICNSGNRSQTAHTLMKEYGFQTVYNVLGGIQAWWRAYV